MTDSDKKALEHLKRSPKVPNVEAPPPELGYVDYSNDIFDRSEGDGGDWMRHEGFRDKFIRKTKENPFVPLGLGLTIAALSYGLWQMKTGNKKMSQKMMRVRVAAQSFTMVALLLGVGYQSYKKNKPSSN